MPCPTCGQPPPCLCGEVSEIVPAAPSSPKPRPTAPAELPPQVRIAAQKPENVVGRYVCVETLGKGGMGIVYRAFDRELHRWVAIKFMTGSISDEDLKRFRREALVMARLQHPNIAQIHEVGEHQGRHCIVMQLIEGKPLPRTKIDDLSPILAQFESVCRAVDYAHAQGIIHRDLKPENIMVDAKGRMTVMDFGLARQQDVRGSMSKTGTAIGTPAYMAPEQASGKNGQVDRQSDVYGLGATLYWIATGRVPFVSEDIYETLMKVVNEDPAPPRALNPRLPGEIETIVLKAMSKEKARRYATAAELADDLHRYAAGEAIQARRASVAYRVRKRITKNPVLSAAVAVALLAVFAAAGFWLQRGAQGQSYAREADRFYSSRDFKSAKEFYDKAIALGFSDASLVNRRGECETKLRDLQKAADAKAVQDTLQPVLDQARGHLETARIMRYQQPWDALRFQSELRRAREACDLALRDAPGYAAPMFLRGQALAEQGDYAAGVGDMELALKASPEMAPSRILLGRAYLRWHLTELFRGAPPESIRRNAEAHLAADDPEGLYVRGRYSEVLARCDEKAPPAGVDKELYALIKGVVLLEQGRPDLAASSLQQAAALAPSERLAWLWLARALADSGLYGDGADAAAKVVELDPDNPHAHLFRGILRAGTGRLDGAIEDYAKALRLKPGFVEAHLHRGRALARLNRFDEAVLDFDAALKLKPDLAAAFFDRALARFEKGDAAGGEADWASARRLDPKLEKKTSEIDRARGGGAGGARTWYRRGEELWNDRQIKPAIEAYSKAIELDPRYAEAYFARGIVRDQSGDGAGALKDYDEAIRLKPDYRSAYLNRSALKCALHDFEGAIRDCDRLIQLAPGDSSGYNNRATARASTGDIQGAIDDCNKAIELNPNDPDALGNRGKYRGQQGDLEGSVEDLTRSLRVKPDHPRSLMDRGVSLAQLGRLDEAIRDFSRAIELDPKYTAAYRNRGLSYYNKKRYAEALRDLNKTIELDPSSAPRLQSLIDDIKGKMD